MPQWVGEWPSVVRAALGRVKHVIHLAWSNKGRVVAYLLIGLLMLYALRSCLPSLSGTRMPARLETAVVEAYEHCDDSFPIWTGDERMPTCDRVTIRSVGPGTVPTSGLAAGITKAFCYHVDVEHLFWGESGSWKHEMAWALRTYSKVAVLKNGEWVLYADEDEADRARWAEFACPGEYEASSHLVPRKS